VAENICRRQARDAGTSRARPGVKGSGELLPPSLASGHRRCCTLTRRCIPRRPDSTRP
jgi:hypothetical protein